MDILRLTVTGWSKEKPAQNWSKVWKITAVNGAEDIGKMLDNKHTTSFKTSGSPSYPWIHIELKRNYFITKVAILSGSEPLMNLQVRVGGSKQKPSGTKVATANRFCGMYYGPTLVPHQWVEIDCGLARGVRGKYLILQLTDRFMVNNPLEITELEIYGWGRVCGMGGPK